MNTIQEYIEKLRDDWIAIRDGINGAYDIESRYRFIKREARYVQYEGGKKW